MKPEPTEAPQLTQLPPPPPGASPADAMNLFVAILQVSRVLEDKIAVDLEAHLGVSLGQIDVLANLSAASSGRLRMRDISDRLLVNRTAVTRLVDDLERRALAERLACQGDRRGVWASITDEGRGMLRRAAPLLDEDLQQYVGRFVNEQEASALRVGLAKILVGNSTSEA